MDPIPQARLQVFMCPCTLYIVLIDPLDLQINVPRHLWCVVTKIRSGMIGLGMY